MLPVLAVLFCFSCKTAPRPHGTASIKNEETANLVFEMPQEETLSVSVKLKWYGTAAILLEYDGTKLLFDPFLFLRDKSYMQPMDELSAVENILVTHGHFDHIADIPAILKHGTGTSTVYSTAKPRETLISKGVDKARIQKITPGDHLVFGPFEVRVLKGKHVVFNSGIIIKTFFRALVSGSKWNNLGYLNKENKICIEAGETVVFDISVANRRILLMGSLNLDDNTEYPKDIDLLVLPFQGRSDINKYAMTFIDRLQPKKVLLDHFDDSFPPISSNVKTEPFISLMRQKYPDISVICPQAGAQWIDIE